MLLPEVALPVDEVFLVHCQGDVVHWRKLVCPGRSSPGYLNAVLGGLNTATY